jgi:hypothetical protein
MNSLGRVSRRINAIYETYYADRETQRFENLYVIYDRIASHVAAISPDVKLEIDLTGLAELIRSYFLDVIRYKEYHFNPKADISKIDQTATILSESGARSLDEIDPLSPSWTKVVHTLGNVNSSKVASYSAKWILKYKPISVVSSVNLSNLDFQSENPAKSLRMRPPGFFLSNINEIYALEVALFALQLDVGDIPVEKIDNLIYSFRFRNFDESSYFSILSKDFLTSNAKN